MTMMRSLTGNENNSNCNSITSNITNKRKDENSAKQFVDDTLKEDKEICVEELSHFDYDEVGDGMACGMFDDNVTSVNSKRLSSALKRNKKTVQFKLQPAFVRCQKLFEGQPPFKESVSLNVQCGSFPWRRTEDIVNDDSSSFTSDYCCSSFGYPAVLQIPGCTVDHLAVENAELYAKLGSSVDEREANFEKLMEDVHQFGEIVFSKLQRSINDIRNYTLHTEEQLINGEHCAVGQFIRDEFKFKKSKPAEEPTVVRPLEEYQNVEEEIIYEDPQHFVSEYTD